MAIQLTNSRNGNPVPPRPVVTEEILTFVAREQFIKEELHHRFGCEDSAEQFIDDLIPICIKHKRDLSGIAKIIVSDFDEKAIDQDLFSEHDWMDIREWTEEMDSLHRRADKLKEEIEGQWGAVYSPLPPLEVGSCVKQGKIVSICADTPAAYLVEPSDPKKEYLQAARTVKIKGKKLLIVHFEQAEEATSK